MAEIREDVLRRLGTLLCEEGKSVLVERSIFNASLFVGKEKGVPCLWSNADFVRVYRGRALRVLRNLDAKSEVVGGGKDLRKAIQEATEEGVKAMDVGAKNYWELCPERWQKEREIIARKEEKTIKKEIRSGVFWCARCKGNNTSYIELQTRSLDESTTYIITCHDCHRSWTQ